MKLARIVDWLDATLNVAAFDDVAVNGLQLGRAEEAGAEVRTVAFAVDASVRAVKAAAAAGAELLVVHHGISWGGGIRRLTGGVGNVVRAATGADLALYACHLPLDAHPTLGNNAQLARLLGLKRVRPAFAYHGVVIGCVGERDGHRIGVCSGGAGEFAEEAQRLGCDVYLTGEANWGDVVAAENCGMTMICAGHYETEVFGVRAVARAMRRALGLRTLDLTAALWSAAPTAAPDRPT
ncbi:MAG: Nif3-like dinuclear metal center hexameric protein [Kiritimatiellia bacterium]